MTIRVEEEVSSSALRGPAAQLAVAVPALSLAGPLSKASHLDPVQLVAWRALLACLILSTYLSWSNRFHERRAWDDVTSEDVRSAAASGICFLMFTSLWTASFPYISIGVSVVLVSMSLFMTFIVTSFQRRAFDASGATGVCLAIVAVVPSLWGEYEQNSDNLAKGVALALSGAVFGTLYYLSLERWGRRGVSPTLQWTLTCGAAAAVAGTWCLVRGNLLDGLDTRAIVVLLTLAIIPQILGQGILVRVSASGRPVLGNLAVVGEAVGAALIATIWFDEPLTVWLVASIGCFLCAATLINSARS